VELGRAFDLENADVGPLTRNAPKMKPLALTLKLARTFVLLDAKLIDLFGIDIVRDPNRHIHMKQHGISLAINLSYLLEQDAPNNRHASRAEKVAARAAA
jgi:hypothetical protein